MPTGSPIDELGLEVSRALLDLVRRVEIQRDLESATAVVAEGLAELVSDAKAECILAACDTEQPRNDATEWQSSSAPKLPAPEAGGESSLLGPVDPHGSCSITSSVIGSDGQHLAVVRVVGSASRAAFSAAEEKLVEIITFHLSGPLCRLIMESDLEKRERAVARALSTAGTVYRANALAHHHSAVTRLGETARLSPGWVAWAFRAIALALVTGLLFVSCVRVTRHTDGPAIVDLSGIQQVTAPVEGTVTSVLVRPGQHVERGQTVITLYDAAEEANLRRLKQAFSLDLIKRLYDPADSSTAQELSDLRSQENLARDELQRRTVRSPVSGTITDVYVRSGQVYSPGRVLLSVQKGGSVPSLIGFLPGKFRPELKKDMPLRIHIQGYDDAFQKARIAAVGSEVVGPAEARRYLAPTVADAVSIDGPTVVVRAKLPAATFKSGSRLYSYHDGMQARVRVILGSERLIFVMVPALRRLVGGNGQ